MEIPTAQEVTDAHHAIVAEGAGSPTTIDIGMLVHSDPVLQQIVKQIVIGAVYMSPEIANLSLPNPGGTPAFLRALVQGAMMSGLNHGLRIGIARQEKARATAQA